MAANSENFSPNRVTLDPADYPDGVLRIFLTGEEEARVVLNLDGSIDAGDGVTPPVSTATALADLFPDAPVEVDPESVTLAEDLFTALETLGLVAAPEA